MTPFKPASPRVLAALAGVLSLAAMPALAHSGAAAASGFMAGFTHPVVGLDHVLAMVTVGLFASQLGGRGLWLVPAAFVAVMVLGGALGIAGVAVPFVELGIALSVVVLGAAVALRIKAPLALAMGLVGLFAIFHGHAHGGEMPVASSGLSYGLGFLLATAALHAAGVGAGMVARGLASRTGTMAVRAAGAAIAATGLGLLGGAV